MKKTVLLFACCIHTFTMAMQPPHQGNFFDPNQFIANDQEMKNNVLLEIGQLHKQKNVYENSEFFFKKTLEIINSNACHDQPILLRQTTIRLLTYAKNDQDIAIIKKFIEYGVFHKIPEENIYFFLKKQSWAPAQKNNFLKNALLAELLKPNPALDPHSPK